MVPLTFKEIRGALRDQPYKRTDLEQLNRKIDWRKTLQRVDENIIPQNYEIVYDNLACEDKGHYYQHLSRRLSYSKCYDDNKSFEDYKYSDKNKKEEDSPSISGIQSPNKSRFGSQNSRSGI